MMSACHQLEKPRSIVMPQMVPFSECSFFKIFRCFKCLEFRNFCIIICNIIPFDHGITLWTVGC